MRISLTFGAGVTAEALLVGSLAAIAPTASDPTASAAGVFSCPELVSGGSCTFTHDQVGDDPSAIEIPTGVTTVSVLLTGAQGAEAEPFVAPTLTRSGTTGWAQGGGGGAVLAVIDVAAEKELSFQLGARGSGVDGGAGFQPGGRGGIARVKPIFGGGSPGAGGGGASGVWGRDGAGAPFLVAGGGGGGGSNNTELVGLTTTKLYPGGGGGNAGAPAGDGRLANTDRGADGAGGPGGAWYLSTSHPSGQDGPTAYFGESAEVGGGGGGGGWPSGGGYGGAGNFRGFGAGGGGGGGQSFARPGVSKAWFGTNARGAGTITVIGGAPRELLCGQPALVLEPDPAVTQYTVAMMGGQSDSGDGLARKGDGGMVIASYDAPGVPQTVTGCDPTYAGGGKGTSSSTFGDDGGDGGTASSITGPVGPLIVSGGGGAPGGKYYTFFTNAHGGDGGNANGIPGTASIADGRHGWTLNSGHVDTTAGGCTGCSWKSSGDNGSHSDHGGGGGGGGGGLQGGTGGDYGANDDAGGGGGSGRSFISPLLNNRLAMLPLMTSQQPASGFALIWERRVPSASVTVGPVTTGQGADFARGPWAASLVCTEATGETRLTKTVSMEPGFPAQVDGLRAGWTCSVSESDTRGATRVEPGTTSVTLVSGANPVQFVNTYEVGALVIKGRSRLTGGSSEFALGDNVFAVTCTFEGRVIGLPSPAVSGTVRVPAARVGASFETRIDGIPVGASCVVTETHAAGASVIEYSVGGIPTSSPRPVNIPPAGPATVEVTNTFTTASITIDKQVDGSGTAPTGAIFPVTAACSFRGEGISPTFSADMRLGGPAVLDGVPVGATCGIFEMNTRGAVAVAFRPGSTVVVGATGSSATVVNTYDASPLAITLENAGAGSAAANVAYTVDYSCEIGGIDTPGAVEIPAGGGTALVAADDGADCRITAVSDSGRSTTEYGAGSTGGWSPDISAAAARVSPSSDDTLRIRAIYPTDEIEIVSGTTGRAAEFSNADTTVSIGACTFNGRPLTVDQRFTFPPVGGTSRSAGIVRGAECVVTQTVGNGGVVGYSVDGRSAVADPPTIEVAPAGIVAVDNRFDAGSVDISVVNTGAAAWSANTATSVSVACTFNGVPVPGVGVGGLLTLGFLPDGTPQDPRASSPLGLLPAGARCEVASQSDGGATSTVVSSPTVTVDDGDVPVVVTHIFDSAPLTISVVVRGDDAPRHSADVFAVSTTCAFNGLVLHPQTTPAWQTLTDVVANATSSFSGLPIGAVCTSRLENDNHATMIVPADGVRQVTVTPAGDGAAFSAEFEVAALPMTLTSSGVGANVYSAGKVRAFRLACFYSDGAPLPLPDSGRLELVGPDALKTISLPRGALCSVRESDPSPFTERRLIDRAVVGSDDAGILSASYRYDLTDLTVRKITPGSTEPEPYDYGFSAACSWRDPDEASSLPKRVAIASGNADFTARAGGEYSLSVLRGSDCTLAETDAGSATSTSIEAGDRTFSERSAVFATADAERLTVTVRNTLPGALPATGFDGLAAFLIGLVIVAAGGVLTILRLRRRGGGRHLRVGA